MKYNITLLKSTFLLLTLLTGSYSLSYSQTKYDSQKANHLQLSSDNKTLFWFYTVHTVDPHDVMFQDIENKMTSFKPDLVLTEGGTSKRSYKSREHAISKGESAFTSYIASQSNIQVMDIEPPLDAQIEFLQGKYEPKSVLALYLARQLGSIQLLKTTSNYDLEKLLMSESNILADNGLKINKDLLTLDYILEAINANISKPININNWQESKLYREYGSKPDKSGKAMSNIYNDLVLFRDTYLVQLIKTKKEEYSNIFVVMGYAHLEATKNRIEEIYK